VVEKGCIHLFQGNYEDFINIWKKRLDDEQSDTVESLESTKQTSTSTARRLQDQKRQEAQWRNQLYREKKPLQESLAKLDASLNDFHQLLDSLNRQLGDPETYTDGAKVQQLQKDYQQCQKRISELTAQWEADALALEELEESFWKDKEIIGSSVS